MNYYCGRGVCTHKKHDPLPERTSNPFCIFVTDDHLLVPTCTYLEKDRHTEKIVSAMAQSEIKLGFHEMDLDNRLLKVCVCEEGGNDINCINESTAYFLCMLQ